jgi:hypothetical protein
VDFNKKMLSPNKPFNSAENGILASSEITTVHYFFLFIPVFLQFSEKLVFIPVLGFWAIFQALGRGRPVTTQDTATQKDKDKHQWIRAYGLNPSP